MQKFLAPPSSSDRGRARYRRDLVRLLRRFGTVEAALRWLRARDRDAGLPPARHWDDQEAGR